jgi:hypothetical protein
MTHGQASRLSHVGRRKEINAGSGFDLLAHQAGWPEFWRCDRIWARRKSAQQIGKGTREAPRARHMQHVRPRGGHQSQNHQKS